MFVKCVPSKSEAINIKVSSKAVLWYMFVIVSLTNTYNSVPRRLLEMRIVNVEVETNKKCTNLTTKSCQIVSNTSLYIVEILFYCHVFATLVFEY